MITLQQNSNIRRIDELGRIVIPKDIRKKLHIKDNEPLEVYIRDDEIRIKKYSALPDALEYINYIVDMGSRVTGNNFIVTDRERIIASSSAVLKDLPLDKNLSDLVYTCTDTKNENIDIDINGFKIDGYASIVPIIIDNDRSGLIIEYNNEPISNIDIIKIFKNLIETRLNNY